MLESLRRRDPSRSPAHQSPYGQMQEALNPSAHPESSKAETTPKAAPKADGQESAKPTPSTEESVSKLIVGPDIKLRGAEITDCDTLVVEGRVEASMDSRVIQITEHGVFVGKVGIDVAEIRGRFEGELTARKQLVIRATGRVSGKIRYGKVAIEEGGELSGDIASMTASASSRDLPTSVETERKAVAGATAGLPAASSQPAIFAKGTGAPR